MLRIIPAGAIGFAFLVTSFGLEGQTPDARLDDAVTEIALLKRIIAEQDRRLATLERTVKSLQTTVVAASAARPVPPARRSRTADAWASVKTGMSRAEVVDILGEPTSTDSVIDRKTLFYKDSAETIGTVTLVDDRVSEADAPRFQIHTTATQ
jgi:hypothetical protein